MRTALFMMTVVAVFSLPSIAQEKLATGVGWFETRNNGKTIIYDTPDGVFRLDDGKATPRNICPAGSRMIYANSSEIKPLQDAILAETDGCLVHVNLTNGSTTELVKACSSAEVVEYGLDGNWCIVQVRVDRERAKPRYDYYRVDLNRATSERVLKTTSEIEDQTADFRRAVLEKNTLTVNCPGPKDKTLLQYRVDIKTKAVKSKVISEDEEADSPTTKPAETFDSLDGKTKVVIGRTDGKMVTGKEERDLDLPKSERWALPNRKAKPGFLTIYSVSDTNKDGKIDRNEGDLIEIYLLDLRTLKLALLADSKKENIGRDWSEDGRFAFWSRCEDRHSLYAHDTVTGKTSKLIDAAKFCIPCITLPDGRLIVNVDSGSSLTLVDLLDEKAKPVKVLGNVFSKWTLTANNTLVYWASGDQGDLIRIKIPPRTISTQPTTAP